MHSAIPLALVHLPVLYLLKRLRRLSRYQSFVVFLSWLGCVTYLGAEGAIGDLWTRAYPPDQEIVYQRIRALNKISLIYPRALIYDLEFLGRRLWPHSLFEQQELQRTETGFQSLFFDDNWKVRIYHGYTWWLPASWKNSLDKRYKDFLDSHSSIRQQQALTIEEPELEIRFSQEFTAGGGRFKIQVSEGGKVELLCMDSFEKVFGVSRDVLRDCPLVDLLRPSVIPQHAEVVDALLDVICQLSHKYLETKPLISMQKATNKAPRQRALEELAANPEIKQFLQSAEGVSAQGGDKDKRKLLEDLKQVKEVSRKEWPRF